MSLSSCPTLCDPRDGSPLDSPIPGILQARTLEWVAISFSNASKWKVKVKSLSLVWLLATPWTAAHQAPPPMGFCRQEYWSGVPLPSPWDCPHFFLSCFLHVALFQLFLLFYLPAHFSNLLLLSFCSWFPLMFSPQLLCSLLIVCSLNLGPWWKFLVSSQSVSPTCLCVPLFYFHDFRSSLLSLFWIYFNADWLFLHLFGLLAFHHAPSAAACFYVSSYCWLYCVWLEVVVPFNCAVFPLPLEGSCDSWCLMKFPW